MTCSSSQNAKSTSTSCTTCTNSGAECCDTKTCESESITCGSEYIAKALSTPCTTCSNDGAECCDAIKTCGSESVACSASQVAKVSTATCTTCINDGAECCDAKTCGSESITCGSEYNAKPTSTSCTTCSNDGAECCDTKTCGSESVTCSASQVAKASTATCTTCSNDQDECCEKKTCSNGGDGGALQSYPMYQNTTWAKAKTQCESYGKSLCFQSDMCPDGDLSTPIGGNRASDIWTPSIDFPNSWISIGNYAVSKRSCVEYNKVGTLNQGAGQPTWGTGTDNLYYRQEVLCCTTPSAVFPRQVTCSAESVAKAVSTPCTTCSNGGNECCAPKPSVTPVTPVTPVPEATSPSPQSAIPATGSGNGNDDIDGNDGTGGDNKDEGTDINDGSNTAGNGDSPSNSIDPNEERNSNNDKTTTNNDAGDKQKGMTDGEIVGLVFGLLFFCCIMFCCAFYIYMQCFQDGNIRNKQNKYLDEIDSELGIYGNHEMVAFDSRRGSKFKNPLHKESNETTLPVLPPTLPPRTSIDPPTLPPRTSIDVAEVEKSVRRTSVVKKSRRTSVKKSRRASRRASQTNNTMKQIEANPQNHSRKGSSGFFSASPPPPTKTKSSTEHVEKLPSKGATHKKQKPPPAPKGFRKNKKEKLTKN